MPWQMIFNTTWIDVLFHAFLLQTLFYLSSFASSIYVLSVQVVSVKSESRSLIINIEHYCLLLI